MGEKIVKIPVDSIEIIPTEILRLLASGSKQIFGLKFALTIMGKVGILC